MSEDQLKMPCHSITREALELEARDVLRHVQCSLADLAAVLEQLRQAAAAAAEAPPRDHRLVIEMGPCGRPEVV